MYSVVWDDVSQETRVYGNALSDNPYLASYVCCVANRLGRENPLPTIDFLKLRRCRRSYSFKPNVRVIGKQCKRISTWCFCRHCQTLISRRLLGRATDPIDTRRDSSYSPLLESLSIHNCNGALLHDICAWVQTPALRSDPRVWSRHRFPMDFVVVSWKTTLMP